MLTHRRFIRLSAAASGLGLGTGFYTWRCEPHWLEIVERRLPIANLPDRLIDKRLALISDIHIGPQVDDGYLIRAFDLVRKLAPDIIAYASPATPTVASASHRSCRPRCCRSQTATTSPANTN